MEEFFPTKYIKTGGESDYGQFGVDSYYLSGLMMSNLAILYRFVSIGTFLWN